MTVGTVSGTTAAFTIANPTITVVPAEASPEDTIVINGSGFNALSALTVKPGKNVIAVDVHQRGPTSSDLGFDLRLTGYALRRESRPAEESAK